MLVLTRKLGENILVGDDIIIKVINIDNHRVQIGIQAPSAISIYRMELVEKVKEQNHSSIIKKKHDLIQAARKLRKLWRVA
ncbi:MAG: carbon storage regulator CsrA [Calditrichia bacterium]